MRGPLLILLALTACGATAKQAEKAPLPDPVTRATLAGHRCKTADNCLCRPLEGDAAEQQPPAEGTKRFELRVASSDGVAWVTIDGRDVLYKNQERNEDCFYVDLAPGDHSFSLRAKAERAEGGIGAGLRVHEYDAKNQRWYDSFLFSCGAPGACAKDVLVDWKKSVERDRTLMLDPCGTTRVRALRWETGRMPDAVHPEEILIAFTLKIGPGQPDNPPRDASCPIN